jgi:hypothetical protein
MTTLVTILLIWCALSVVVGFILGPILRAGREYREAFDAETVRLADEDEAMAQARAPREALYDHIARAMAAGVDDEWAEMNGGAA